MKLDFQGVAKHVKFAANGDSGSSYIAYKVVKGDNNTPRVDIDGRLYTPQELSAMILQKMKKKSFHI